MNAYRTAPIAQRLHIVVYVQGPFGSLPIEACVDSINGQDGVERVTRRLEAEGFRVLGVECCEMRSV